MGGAEQHPSRLQVIDVLRRFAPAFMTRQASVAYQVKSVLSKILLCRTAALQGRLHRCPQCRTEINVYNSCGDRHCPQCNGSRRADWLDKTAELLLPNVDYFQIVFTLPSKLSALAMGNRKELYGLLFSSAWKALDGELRRTGRFQPAALMVLHTWNQELDHHPHLHALVPGGGPSLNGKRWIHSKHPRHRNRRKPYLTDRDALANAFQRHYLAGLRRLFRKSCLKVDTDRQPELSCASRRERWLKGLEAQNWNVYLQGPPQAANRPEHVLKYLARYMTGGPISSSRMIHLGQREATFWARSRDRRNRSRPFTLPGHEFVRRWTMHILPKNFTKSRSYGGYHTTKRKDYLQRSRELLPGAELDERGAIDTRKLPVDEEGAAPRKCPHCNSEMKLIADCPRPSWKQVFDVRVYEEPSDYCPLLHIPHAASRAPP